LYKEWQRRNEKFLDQLLKAKRTFFIVTFHFSIGKSTINAPRAFGNCAESILLALASAQQCLAALQRERGNLVQPLRKPPTGLVPPLTKAKLIFISDFPIGFQIGN
jgi:hypothetical protein